MDTRQNGKPISPDIVLNNFHRYEDCIANLQKESLKEEKIIALLRQQDICLALCDKLAPEEKPLKILLQILIYSTTLLKYDDLTIGKKVGGLMGKLFVAVKNKSGFSEYSKYDNYFLAILILWINSYITNYCITQFDIYLIRLAEIHQVLLGFINARGEKGDSVGMLAEFFLARTSYVFEFSGLYKNGKVTLKEFLNRGEYDAIHKKIQKRFTSLTKMSSEQECFLLLFNVYNLCIMRSNGSETTKTPTDYNLLEKSFNLTLPQFIDNFQLFCTAFSYNKDSEVVKPLLPTKTSSSVCGLLSSYTEYTLVSIELNDRFQAAVSEILQTDQQYTQLLPVHIKHLECKLALYTFKNQCSGPMAVKCETQTISDEISQLKATLNGKINAANSQAATALNATKALVRTETKAPKQYPMQNIRSKLKEQGANKDNLPKQNKASKRPYSELKQIPNLLQQRNFKGASKITHRLRNDAEGKQDISALLEIYTALGDINIAWAETKSTIGRKHKLEMAAKYYRRSLFILDQLITESRDEKFAALREIILQSIPVQDQPSAPAHEEQAPATIPLPSSVNIKTSETQMQQFLDPFDLPEYIELIAEKLIEAGHNVYLVGGAVRDYPLPPNDYDLVTSASIQEISTLLPQAEVYSHHHPVVQINVNAKAVKISTLCTDKNSSDIEVVLAPNDWMIFLYRTKNLYEDAKRRVFTCNALYYDFCNEMVIDYFNGLQHVQRREIHFIEKPERALRRDPTLVFRMIRLITNLDFKIDQAIEKIIPTFTIKPEHAKHELMKTIKDNKSSTLAKLKQWQVLENIYNLSSEDCVLLRNAWRLILSRQKDQNNILLLWGMLIYIQAKKENFLQVIPKLAVPSYLRNSLINILKILYAKDENQHDVLVKMNYSAVEYTLAIRLRSIINDSCQYQASRQMLKVGLFQEEFVWKKLKRISLKLQDSLKEIRLENNKLVLKLQPGVKMVDEFTSILECIDKTLTSSQLGDECIYHFKNPAMAKSVRDFLGYHRRVQLSI